MEDSDWPSCSVLKGPQARKPPAVPFEEAPQFAQRFRASVLFAAEAQAASLLLLGWIFILDVCVFFSKRNQHRHFFLAQTGQLELVANPQKSCPAPELPAKVTTLSQRGSRTLGSFPMVGKGPRIPIHGCCWETFYIFAYCGFSGKFPLSC